MFVILPLWWIKMNKASSVHKYANIMHSWTHAQHTCTNTAKCDFGYVNVSAARLTLSNLHTLAIETGWLICIYLAIKGYAPVARCKQRSSELVSFAFARFSDDIRSRFDALSFTADINDFYADVACVCAAWLLRFTSDVI